MASEVEQIIFGITVPFIGCTNIPSFVVSQL